MTPRSVTARAGAGSWWGRGAAAHPARCAQSPNPHSARLRADFMAYPLRDGETAQMMLSARTAPPLGVFGRTAEAATPKGVHLLACQTPLAGSTSGRCARCCGPADTTG